MQVYKTRGVCSQAIQFELDGDTIKHVNFIGGCSGNTQGVGTPSRRHESKRCHRQTGRHPLWSKTNFLPGSAGKSIKRSNQCIISGLYSYNMMWVSKVPNNDCNRVGGGD